MMNPLRNVDYQASGYDEDWLLSVAPMLAVPVGLAIRKVGE